MYNPQNGEKSGFGQSVCVSVCLSVCLSVLPLSEGPPFLFVCFLRCLFLFPARAYVLFFCLFFYGLRFGLSSESSVTDGLVGVSPLRKTISNPPETYNHNCSLSEKTYHKSVSLPGGKNCDIDPESNRVVRELQGLTLAHDWARRNTERGEKSRTPSPSKAKMTFLEGFRNTLRQKTKSGSDSANGYGNPTNSGIGISDENQSDNRLETDIKSPSVSFFFSFLFTNCYEQLWLNLTIPRWLM